MLLTYSYVFGILALLVIIETFKTMDIIVLMAFIFGLVVAAIVAAMGVFSFIVERESRIARQKRHKDIEDTLND